MNFEGIDHQSTHESFAHNPAYGPQRSISGRQRFERAKPVIHLLRRLVLCAPASLRSRLFRSLRTTNGTLGLLSRYVVLSTLARASGDNVGIHPGVYVLHPEGLTLGSNISVHPMSYLDATGGITIGSDVSIAHGATILSTTHTFSNREVPVKYQPIRNKSTTIEDDVWVGAKAIILSGVVIGRGAIVGAGAVVTSDIPPFTIAVGIPARVASVRPGNSPSQDESEDDK